MKIQHYWNLLRGKTEALNPARFDFKHAWAVLQSWVREKFPTPKHVKEQIIWRRGEVLKKCPECWEKGRCIYCGCFILGKTEADMACEEEGQCYPKMMNKKQWKEFKIANNIKLFN